MELLQQYSYAQIILEKNTTTLFLSGMHADIFEDSSNSLSLYEVVKKDFTKLNIPIVKNTNPKSTYWLRFKIKNQGDIKTKWVLEGITPNLYSLEIWIPDYANQMTSYISGLKNNASKVYPHKNYIFDLPSSLKEYDIYIKVSEIYLY